jgi:hypothetical protein
VFLKLFVSHFNVKRKKEKDYLHPSRRPPDRLRYLPARDDEQKNAKESGTGEVMERAGVFASVTLVI